MRIWARILMLVAICTIFAFGIAKAADNTGTKTTPLDTRTPTVVRSPLAQAIPVAKPLPLVAPRTATIAQPAAQATLPAAVGDLLPDTTILKSDFRTDLNDTKGEAPKVLVGAGVDTTKLKKWEGLALVKLYDSVDSLEEGKTYFVLGPQTVTTTLKGVTLIGVPVGDTPSLGARLAERNAQNLPQLNSIATLVKNEPSPELVERLNKLYSGVTIPPPDEKTLSNLTNLSMLNIKSAMPVLNVRGEVHVAGSYLYGLTVNLQNDAALVFDTAKELTVVQDVRFGGSEKSVLKSSGSGASGTGGFSMSDSEISGSHTCFEAYDSNGIVLKRNKFHECVIGIDANNSSDLNITGNNIYNITGEVTGTEVNAAIRLANSHAIIEQNNIYNCSGYGIVVQDGGATLSNNVIHDCTLRGISVKTNGASTITYNNIYNMKGVPDHSTIGIYVNTPNTASPISNNKIHDIVTQGNNGENGIGIWLENPKAAALDENDINNVNLAGVNVNGGKAALVGNKIQKTKWAIYDYGGDLGVSTDNTIADAIWAGFVFFYNKNTKEVPKGTLRGNTIRRTGIAFYIVRGTPTLDKNVMKEDVRVCVANLSPDATGGADKYVSALENFWMTSEPDPQAIVSTSWDKAFGNKTELSPDDITGFRKGPVNIFNVGSPGTSLKDWTIPFTLSNIDPYTNLFRGLGGACTLIPQY